MVTSRKKTRRKKSKPLRQEWRDLVSWWTRAKKAKADRVAQGVRDAKIRAAAAQKKAASKAEKDKVRAENRAKKDAAQAVERQAASARAQQRAAERQSGGRRVQGTIVQPVAALCGTPLPEDPRQTCSHPVLPGTPTCAAGHPQGRNQHAGHTAAWTRLGFPMTAKDDRLFALRESGYQGPIDQDGYAVGENWAAEQLAKGRRRE